MADYRLSKTGPRIDDVLDNSARQDAIAIVSNGNTHIAITSGQYVYVKNHGTLAEGLYVANQNIGANETLTGSKVTAVPSGGLNAIRDWLLIKEIYAVPDATFGFVDTDISLEDYIAVGAWLAFNSNSSVRFSNLDASSTPTRMLRFQIVDCTGNSGNGSVLKSGGYYVYILLISRAGIKMS